MSTNDSSHERTKALALEDDKLYTREEAALLLGISPRQVNNRRREGRLERIVISGACIRFSGRAIRAFIESATEDAQR